MSGIAGVFYANGRPVERAMLEGMVDILAHRGPDGSDIWVEGNVGFGHRMLWTTPESIHERLPLTNRRGDLTITADARIDNRDELLPLLNLNDRPAMEISDSQVILAAYERWGQDCPDKLLGDFAFAIWNARAQHLFCARDHFGVKPFYYYWSGEAFVFGSEIKAILALSEVPKLLNEDRIADYLTAALDDTAATFYQNILRLPPAHSITISSSNCRIRTYWSLDPTPQVRLSSDQAYADRFRELFVEAVRCRVRSAFSVGSMLSGGLDSSSIACAANGVLVTEHARPLHTFSAIFDEVKQSDEQPFINAVLSHDPHHNFVPHHVHGDQFGPLVDLGQVLWHQDEAFFAGNLFLNWGMYGCAREHGVRVMLDGFDGDTTVSHGVTYLSDLASANRWLKLKQEVYGYAQNFDLSPRRLLWNYVRRHGISGQIWNSKALAVTRQVARTLLRRPRTMASRVANRNAFGGVVLNADFVQRLNFAERYNALRDVRLGPPQNEQESHFRTITWGLMPYTMEILDRTAAAFSVEGRYPFWDKRLVEYCLGLPPEQKIRRGWTRWILRRAMDGILPNEVQWRGGKANLGPNFERGLLTLDRALVEDVVLKDQEGLEPYVDMRALCDSYQRLLDQTSNDYDLIVVWRAVSLALWLRQANWTDSTLEQKGGDTHEQREASLHKANA